MAMTANLSDAISEFLDSRRARGIKPRTIANERVVLKQLLATVGNIQVKNLTSRHIDMYFTRYSHLSAGTWNRNVGYLQGFFKWCRGRRYATRDFDPLDGIKNRKVIPREFIFVPPSRFPELLDAAKTPRDRILIALGLYTFQRSSEIKRLRWADIYIDGDDHKRWRINTHRSKTEQRDSLPVSAELYRELKRWRLEYGRVAGRPPEPHWLVVPAYQKGMWEQGADGRIRSLSKVAINPTVPYRDTFKAVTYALEKIGYRDFRHEGCHTLRRSGGLAYYEHLAWTAGHDGALRIVQSMYGHANLSTTERYLRLSLERKRRNALVAGEWMFPEAGEAKVFDISSGGENTTGMGARAELKENSGAEDGGRVGVRQVL